MMFVDACAIVSMMAGEDTASAYEASLTQADAGFTSALAAWEAIIGLSRPDQLDCRYSEAEAAVTEWLDARGIELREPAATREVLTHAVRVAERHGIGRRALSNFDCFHFAHANASGASLLTLDRLLRQTDLPTQPGDP